MEFRKILVLCGGREAVEEACKIKAPAISLWRRRGIPQMHWHKIIDLSAGKVSFEDLAEFENQCLSEK